MALLDEKIRKYRTGPNPEEILRYQMKKLNVVWKKAYTDIPFYREWKHANNLPDVIDSLEVLESFPVLTKSVIYENQELIQRGLKGYYLISTGGTSGVTAHFPTSKKDADEAYANAYLGRSWWDIHPFSPILMFWGHSHLFGSAFKGLMGKIKRKINDWLINTKRISSYSLDVGNVKRFYDAIALSRSETIISYTSNLFKICKFMESNRLTLRRRPLKNVILTSETATKADVTMIMKYLEANVIQEYGMAETGVIAYSYKKTDNIRVLWDSFIIQVDNSGNLFLTTLCEKIFPLFRYDSEDKVRVTAQHHGSILAIGSIEGKVRNILSVPGIGEKKLAISTIFFDHILKYYPGIYAIQYRQLDDAVEIILSSDKSLDLVALKKYMVREMAKEFKNICLEKIWLRQGIASKTISGKHRVMLN